MYPWLRLGVCVFCDCLFLAIHHFAASSLNENWKQKCEISHVFSPFGLCGSHACSSGALHWCVCMWACVMCREGALDGLDFFFFSLKKHHKNQPNKWDFFLVYASSKLQSRSTRLKIPPLFHQGKQLFMGFFPFVAGPGTRKERLKEVKAVVLISYIYVLLTWEEDAPSLSFS